MGRPKGSLGARTKKIKTVSDTSISCGICGVTKKEVEFYLSSNPLHRNGKLPYCKKCIKKMCFNEDKKLDLDKVKKMLQMVDRPFLYEILKSSVASDSNTIGDYFKNLQLAQYRHLGYADSVFEPQCEYDDVPIELDKDKPKENFSVTDEMEEFFGAGFSSAEYQAMFKKYNFLKNNYPETTNMHIEALKTYVRYKVKEEFATAKGDVGTAGKWADLASKAATSAKINPSQLSKADLQGGLNSVAELMKAAEQAVDILPILPKYKCQPNDALDFVIWCYVNYTRDLKGLPLCEYEDIYAFYDKKKAEYIDQYGDIYGIFTDDPTEQNRDKLVQFIVKPSLDMEGDEDG